MFSIIRLCLLSAIFLAITTTTVMAAGLEGERVHLVALSNDQAMHPIVLDLETEEAFDLKLKLPPKFNYNVFLNTKANKIIVVQEDALNEIVKIYINDFTEEKLSSPVFSTVDKGTFWLSRCAWSSNAQTLIFTGRYVGESAHSKKLVLTLLDFSKRDIRVKDYNLSHYMYSHTSIWGLSSHVMVIGRSSKAIDEKGEPPDKSLVVDLKNNSIKEIAFAKNKMTIVGHLGPNQLAVTDFKKVYSYDLVSLNKVCDYPEGLNVIYGVSEKKSGYFAMLTKVGEEKGNYFEKEILSFISFNNSTYYKELYSGKRIGTVTSSFVSKAH
jgi:hypothetical protein